MNKEQLQIQIEEMKSKLAEMELELNKPEVTINYWQPNEGDNMYYVTYLGDVSSSYYRDDYQLDTRRYRVFKTREEAKRYDEYIKAEETLRRVIAEANKGWIPDFNNKEDKKYFAYLDRKLEVDYWTTIKFLPSFMYIKTRELAFELLEKYEQEFKTYLSY